MQELSFKRFLAGRTESADHLNVRRVHNDSGDEACGYAVSGTGAFGDNASQRPSVRVYRVSKRKPDGSLLSQWIVRLRNPPIRHSSARILQRI